MSVNKSTVILFFGDGEHPFNVAKLGERTELEDNAGFGTHHMLRRIVAGEATFKEIRETIRIGLIGGGMAPEAALRLVRRYVDDMPRAENVLVAQAILLGEIMGIPTDDPVGKLEAERAATEEPESPSTATTGDSSVPPSTDSARPFISLPEKSTGLPSGS